MRVLGSEGCELQRDGLLGFVCYEYETVVFVYFFELDMIKLWSFRGSNDR